MATEKLYDVTTSGRYDLIILDTPPVKNALDFLDSPGRMAKFVDKKIMQWFLTPYEERQNRSSRSLFSRLISGTSAALFKLLSHIFGKDFGRYSDFSFNISVICTKVFSTETSSS